MPAKLAGLSLQFELEAPFSKLVVTGSLEEPQFLLFLPGFEQPNAVCTRAQLVAAAHQLIWVAQTVAGLPKQSSSQEAATHDPFARGDEAAELTQALLMGTLGIGQNGLAVVDDDEEPMGPVRRRRIAAEALRDEVRRAEEQRNREYADNRRRQAMQREHERIARERALQAQHPPQLPGATAVATARAVPGVANAGIVPPVGQFQQPGARVPAQFAPVLRRRAPSDMDRVTGYCGTGGMHTLLPARLCQTCPGCGGLAGSEVAKLRRGWLGSPREANPAANQGWVDMDVVEALQARRPNLQDGDVVNMLRGWMIRLVSTYGMTAVLTW